MSVEPLFSLKNRWFTISAGLAAGFATAMAVTGLIVLPYAQPGLKLNGIWDAICSAAGVPQNPEISAPVTSGIKTSTVVMTSGMLSHPSAASIGHGATLALQCGICHGSDGVSQSNFPYLAGQYAGVIYKELHDFKSGARVSAVMSPFAADMSEQDIIDLAAYYSYLPLVSIYHPKASGPGPKIVINGAPLRNIPLCAACHGSEDHKAGASRLEGQPAVYIKAQLQAFSTLSRRNDISEQMRNIARHLTPAEIDEAAAYYTNQP